MSATRLKQIEEIYHAAANSAPAHRETLLNSECGDDDVLLQEVRSLLSYDEISDSLIDGTPDAIAAEMFAEELDSELTGTTIGHYRIERLLGEGGMGKVYLAEDTLLSRKVALKILPQSLVEQSDRLKRFKQEAKAASGLNHPNILTIHEFGTDEGANYIVTEFIDGVTLREKMSEQMSLGETMDIAVQAASALSAAHNAGIVHRDIKPENIMIRRDGILKVLDFGLAKFSMPAPGTGSEAATMFRTEPGKVMGTPNYMSPEQARGVNVDARTDIWSLGVIIYEMTSGQLPFAGQTQTDVLVAILNQPVPMIDIFERDAPAELRRVIEKALAKNANERYGNVEELASDLKRICNRLEFENELKRTQADPNLTRAVRDREPVTRVLRAAGPVAVDTPVPAAGIDNGRKYVLTAVSAVAALVLIVITMAWYNSRPQAVAADPPIVAQPAVPASSRTLTYSLTVQSFTDGRYKEPFTLTGEMLFRNRDRVRINVKGIQPGYLYILNQGPSDAAGKASYNILFPTPATNNGLSFLSANEEIQIPRQSWFELDQKEGSELVWLVWSEKIIGNLESAKRFANNVDHGRIQDPELIQSIAALLQSPASTAVKVERDDGQKTSYVKGSGDVIAHAVKLEHH